MQAARKIKYAISQKLELIATNGLQIWIHKNTKLDLEFGTLLFFITIKKNHKKMKSS